MKLPVLTYDNKMKEMIENVIKEYSALFLVDSRYLYFHNHTCPRCRRKMVDKKSNLVKAASISFFMPAFSSHLIIPYSLCKACYRHTKLAEKDMTIEQNQLIDQYIVSKLRGVDVNG